jgi:hypothetical protein
MGDKWERALVVPAGDQGEAEREEIRRLLGYGIRAVFSRRARPRERSLPVSYLQTHRGFPKKCPELYCSASIRLEPADGCFLYHGRGQALECYNGHRFVCFRFRRLMVLSKLDLYLARLDAEKWQQVLHFPVRSGYGRGLLRALWEAPYEEVLCGSAAPKDARILAGWRGFRRRFARELQADDRAKIRAKVRGCLDLCSEGLRHAHDYVGAVEFACAAGHRVLVSRTERGTFLSSRLLLSFSLAAESL